MKALAIAALLCLIAITGCQSVPTVYAAAAVPGAVGYSETAIEADRWRVTFQGGVGATASLLRAYALRRAADLTLARGYDWFQITDSFTEGSSACLTLEIVMGRGALPSEPDTFDSRQVRRAFGRAA